MNKNIVKRKYDIVDIEKFGEEYQFFKELYYLMKKHGVSIFAVDSKEKDDQGRPYSEILFEFPNHDFRATDMCIDYSVVTQFERVCRDGEQNSKQKIVLSATPWTKKSLEKANSLQLNEIDDYE